MSKLILMRHTETIFNEAQIFSGQLDIPLSFNGILHARKLGDNIKKYSLDLVFVSSLERTKQTAAIALQVYSDFHKNRFPLFIKSENQYDLSKYIPIQEDCRLNERNYGICEGKQKDSIIDEFGMESVFKWRRSWNTAPIGGETLSSVCTRTSEFLYERIMPKLNDGMSILIVCHQNTMRALKIIIEKIESNKVENIEFDNGELVELEYEKCYGFNYSKNY
jgi:2,3-bisphosphoglycerate-dependent phosphoglycerate mutase